MQLNKLKLHPSYTYQDDGDDDVSEGGEGESEDGGMGGGVAVLLLPHVGGGVSLGQDLDANHLWIGMETGHT